MTKEKKRCPNGTRRNPKTKNCEKKDLVEPMADKKRCPNGTRRNPITKNCEKKKTTTIPTIQKKSTVTTYSKTVKKPLHKLEKKYTLKKKLGFGTNGQVFLANNEKGEQVAVKIGNPYIIKNQFSKLNILKTKNICKYFICPINYFEKNNKGHIVMDYLKNYMDLQEVIKHNYCISLETKKEIKNNLQTALKLLHNNHLIHSDIKPANIMVKVDHTKKEILSEARIIDIGGLLEKEPHMRLNTITRKYFDTSIVFPHIDSKTITNNDIFAKIYSFNLLKRLDNSALQKTFEKMNQLSSC